MVEVDGVYLKLDRSLSLFMVNVLRRGRFSVEEQELILPALETDDVVMELGGGVGHLSTRISKILGSERVFTFEANPELEPLMRENFRLNGVRPKAEFCLLGHSEGRAAFYVNRDFWVSSREPELGGRRIEVPVYLLNERIRDIDPSFLVVDVEGGERDLFDGLDFHNIRKLCSSYMSICWERRGRANPRIDPRSRLQPRAAQSPPCSFAEMRPDPYSGNG